jgi:hypothetical protein
LPSEAELGNPVVLDPELELYLVAAQWVAHGDCNARLLKCAFVARLPIEVEDKLAENGFEHGVRV